MSVLKDTLAARVQGERASPLRAAMAAVVAGAIAATVTYRVVRS